MSILALPIHLEQISRKYSLNIKQTNLIFMN